MPEARAKPRLKQVFLSVLSLLRFVLEASGQAQKERLQESKVPLLLKWASLPAEPEEPQERKLVSAQLRQEVARALP
jgi:hypothetical protein